MNISQDKKSFQSFLNMGWTVMLAFHWIFILSKPNHQSPIQVWLKLYLWPAEFGLWRKTGLLFEFLSKQNTILEDCWFGGVTAEVLPRVWFYIQIPKLSTTLGSLAKCSRELWMIISPLGLLDVLLSGSSTVSRSRNWLWLVLEKTDQTMTKRHKKKETEVVDGVRMRDGN